MVPYNELTNEGHKLTPDSASIEHQNSFFEDSFDVLLQEGLAQTVHSTIISCPGGCGSKRRPCSAFKGVYALLVSVLPRA